MTSWCSHLHPSRALLRLSHLAEQAKAYSANYAIRLHASSAITIKLQSLSRRQPNPLAPRSVLSVRRPRTT